MEYHPLYGPSVTEKAWVPAPSFLLRRDRILRLMSDCRPGRLLEIGCGAGTILHELSRRKFICEALETSPAALDVATHVNGDDVTFHKEAKSDWRERFDYVLAFEVLEHIEFDRKALMDWYGWIKPGGTILISVPAHMKKWTASDVWAGHYRRYEMQQIKDLLMVVGFEIEKIETYGFPLSNILLPLRARVHARNLSDAASSNARATNNDRSGVERGTESRLYPVLRSLPGLMAMRLALLLQHHSRSKDWGTGYLLLAKKPQAGTPQ